jgi:hypothetical protein
MSRNDGARESRRQRQIRKDGLLTCTPPLPVRLTPSPFSLLPTSFPTLVLDLVFADISSCELSPDPFGGDQ